MRGGGAGLPSIFVIVWVLLFEIASQAQKRNKIYELAIFGRQKQNALLRFINSALPAFDFMHRRNCHSKFSLIRFKFFFFSIVLVGLDLLARSGEQKNYIYLFVISK